MADVWSDEKSCKVLAAGPAKKDGVQRRGGFGPINGVPVWEVLFEGESRPVWVHAETAPGPGEIMAMRTKETTKKDGSGTFVNWFTAEQHEKMTTSKFGGGGNWGPKVDPEAVYRSTALECAVAHIGQGQKSDVVLQLADKYLHYIKTGEKG